LTAGGATVVAKSTRFAGPALALRPWRADGPGSATRVRRMAAGSGRSIPRAGGPRRPGIAVLRTGETMMRAVAVFVGREVRGVAHRHYRPAAGSGRSRLPQHVARWGDPVVTVR